jgi:hypothetical protein
MYGLTHGWLLAALVVAAVPQTRAAGASATPAQGARGVQALAPDPNAPPVIDIALRMVRASSGGSSTARSAVRGDDQAFVYAGLGPCIVGASREDSAHENSITWRASGRLRSVERGIAVADVEWQRLEYRPAGVVAGPRVRTTLTLPLGERVAVDFVDVTGSFCRTNGLIFEIGVAPDHQARLSMSGEGRSAGGGVGGGGGAGRRLTAAGGEAQAERRRQGEEAARAAPVVTRAMPPREYNVDVWLVPGTPDSAAASALAQRMSQTIGGTGGRFAFPPIPFGGVGNDSVVVDISALVIPVAGQQLVVAITRHVTPASGASPVSAGWLEAVPLPKTGDVLSFEIPAPDSAEAIVPRQGYGLRVRIGRAAATPQLPVAPPA